MKKLMLLGVIISLFSFQINAQSVETGVLPSITSAEGQFTEWKKVEFTASGQNVTYEYMGYILSEMQYMQRTFPEMQW